MSAKNRWRYASRTIIKTILAVATVELAYDAAIVSVRNVVLSENQTQGFRYWNGDEVPKRFGGESHVAKLRRTLRQLMNGYREVQRIYIRESPSNIDWICFFPEVESIKSNYGLVGYDSLSALRSCKNLKSLWCPFSDVSDLSALRDLKYLSSLNIRGSLVNNLDDLRGLPLQLLDVSQTRLTTLEPLAKINSLEFLRLSGCQISDWKGLASCKTVIELDVSGTKWPVSSIVRVIQGNPGLKTIVLREIYISEVDYQLLAGAIEKADQLEVCLLDA